MGGKWRVGSVSLLAIFSLVGCGHPATNGNSTATAAAVSTNDSTAANVPSSETSSDAGVWNQYYSDMSSSIKQYTTMLNQYEQFIKDANAGKYDSSQVISKIGTLQIEMTSLKMNVETYSAPDAVFDTHQLFINAVSDLYNGMQGVSDAQLEADLNHAQYVKDITNANSFVTRSDTEMQTYLSDVKSHLNGGTS